jgi:hypothetical protein
MGLPPSDGGEECSLSVQGRPSPTAALQHEKGTAVSEIDALLRRLLDELFRLDPVRATDAGDH